MVGLKILFSLGHRMIF